MTCLLFLFVRVTSRTNMLACSVGDRCGNERSLRSESVRVTSRTNMLVCSVGGQPLNGTSPCNPHGR